MRGLKSGVICGLFFVLSLSFFSVGARADYSEQQEQDYKGTVTRVVDGDTVHFMPQSGFMREDDTNKVMKVRMMGVDTPETHLIINGQRYSQGYWGEKATEQLEKYIPQNTKLLLKDYGTDKYGRVLGKLFQKQYDINWMMVRSGWGIPYIICEGKLCDKDFFKNQNVEEYVKACVLARAEGLGNYNPKKPLKELPFEFRLRVGHRTPDKYVGDLATRKLYQPEDYRKVDLCRRVFFMRKSDALRVGFEE